MFSRFSWSLCRTSSHLSDLRRTCRTMSHLVGPGVLKSGKHLVSVQSVGSSWEERVRIDHKYNWNMFDKTPLPYIECEREITLWCRPCRTQCRPCRTFKKPCADQDFSKIKTVIENQKYANCHSTKIPKGFLFTLCFTGDPSTEFLVAGSSFSACCRTYGTVKIEPENRGTRSQ